MDVGDAGSGPLSVFAERNPIYNIGGGSGIGLNVSLSKQLKLSVGYLADNTFQNSPTGANSPTGGLFNSGYSALGQITFSPSDALSVGLTYVNAFRKMNTTAVGVAGVNSNGIFDLGGNTPVTGNFFSNFSNNPLTRAQGAAINAYGASASFKLAPTISINGYFSYIEADFLTDNRGRGEIWTYGGGVGLADFGKKGNLLGFAAGVEPYLGNARRFGAGLRNQLPIHLEGFYKYQLSDNISITPGVIWVINPGQSSLNSDVVIGTLRTTFTF
jgi:hypothetical protein